MSYINYKGGYCTICPTPYTPLPGQSATQWPASTVARMVLHAYTSSILLIMIP